MSARDEERRPAAPTGTPPVYRVVIDVAVQDLAKLRWCALLLARKSMNDREWSEYRAQHEAGPVAADILELLQFGGDAPLEVGLEIQDTRVYPLDEEE